MKPKGWILESARHSLARKGIETTGITSRVKTFFGSAINKERDYLFKRAESIKASVQDAMEMQDPVKVEMRLNSLRAEQFAWLDRLKLLDKTKEQAQKEKDWEKYRRTLNAISAVGRKSVEISEHLNQLEKYYHELKTRKPALETAKELAITTAKKVGTITAPITHAVIEEEKQFWGLSPRQPIEPMQEMAETQEEPETLAGTLTRPEDEPLISSVFQAFNPEPESLADTVFGVVNPETSPEELEKGFDEIFGKLPITEEQSFEGTELKKGDLPDDQFDLAQLSAGTEVEKEHTDNPEIAKKIAKAHLYEIPNYYSWLLKMEKQAKTQEMKK